MDKNIANYHRLLSGDNSDKKVNIDYLYCFLLMHIFQEKLAILSLTENINSSVNIRKIDIRSYEASVKHNDISCYLDNIYFSKGGKCRNIIRLCPVMKHIWALRKRFSRYNTYNTKKFSNFVSVSL